MSQRDALFDEGLAAYEAGDYYEAHEKWEELWNDEEDDDHRRFLQALIQIASALHKLTHDVEPRGALRLLDRSLEKTAGLPDVHGGVALAALRQDVMRFRKEAERALAAGLRSLDLALVPRVVREGQGIAWRARPGAPLPDAARTFREGVAAYQRGAYYEAHERWEELWRIEPEGPRRRFLQGLIQTAAALHKLFAMKSAAGAIRLFERARSHLTGVPDGMGGLSLKRLLAGIDAALAELPRLAAESRTDLDPTLVPALAPAPN
jgi:predicted metal-dependent hydrolase